LVERLVNISYLQTSRDVIWTNRVQVFCAKMLQLKLVVRYNV